MVSEHDFKRYPELTNGQMSRFYWESPHRQIREDFQAKVISVHDGDTVRVEWDERDFNFPIRFLDIAAPELNEIGGIKSRDWLANQILGEEVTIEIDRDNRVEKWGRLLGRIFHRGINMNKLSILTGHSVSFEDRGVLNDLKTIA